MVKEMRLAIVCLLAAAHCTHGRSPALSVRGGLAGSGLAYVLHEVLAPQVVNRSAQLGYGNGTGPTRPCAEVTAETPHAGSLPNRW